MALIVSHLPLYLSPKPSPSSLTFSHCSLPKSSLVHCCGESSSTSQMENQRPKFNEFPYASPAIKDLMKNLTSTVENRLDSMLLPCTLPQDIQYFHNQSGSAHASILLRSGAPSSPVDSVLGFWLHSELPTGGALNISSLLCYMNDSTDVPHLVIEVIQSSPTSLVLVLDLPHRKDLVLHPDYLETYYEDTGLEKQRQLLYKISEVKPYNSPSLYVRSASSPTVALVQINTSAGGGDRLEEIVRDEVSVAAKEVLQIWLNLCQSGTKLVEEDADEKARLKKRDSMFRNKSIETDLGLSLPRIFGQETADKVMGVLRAKS